MRPFRPHLPFALALFLDPMCQASPTPLFDGKTFNGWEGDTKATWRVVDGALEAGSLLSRQARNDFLATTREYENFDLTLEWKLEGTEGFVNGGVQFRSKRVPNHHEVTGYQADLGAGYDGGLYDESRRNTFLTQPTEEAKKLSRKPLGQWNTYRIRAEGPRIQLWLNGVLTADHTETDPAIPLSGIIAVQIHGDATSLVRYRNLVIEELPPSPKTGEKPSESAPPAKPGALLFNGRDLQGWTGPALAQWRVENGEMVGTANGEPADTWLGGDRPFENFDLRFRAKTEGSIGTGMFFRSDATPGRRITGWQSDIGQGYDGGLFREGFGSGMIAYPSPELVKATVKPGQWNDYRVRAEGRHLRTWVNGVAMADHTDTGKSSRSGVFAIEISGQGKGLVRLKDLEIEELPPSPPEAALPLDPADRMARIADKLPGPRKLEPFAQGKFSLSADDVVVFTGSENMVLEQRTGAVEARLTSQWKQAARFRHMGWEGDTVFHQNRMMEWGSWPENLEAAGTTVVVAWFGQVEVLQKDRTVAEFSEAYGKLLDEFAKRTPRLVVIGPPPFEKPSDPRVPDNTGLNGRVAEFNEAARQLAARRGLVFVDLVGGLAALKPSGPLTRNGMHLNANGLDAVSTVVAGALGGQTGVVPSDLPAAIARKNQLWFDTWRCMNWAFAYGDRNTQPFAAAGSGRPRFVEELRKFQPLLTHADATIQAIAQGRPEPAPLPPPSPRADPPAPTPEEQMAGFKVRVGFEVNLFADEKLGVVRPLQIRWDDRGRLWVACTPSYPQLQPGEHGNDYLLVLEDTDGDGRADKSSRFAEGLTMPMGFEFAPQEIGGGVYVCESTSLIHLADRDSDGRADSRSIILSGFGTGDTHQDANSLRWGPDGCLWFTQGLHIWSYVETPHGLSELSRSGVWRFNPRTLRLDSFLNESAAGLNCWGTAWDDFGQVFHGSGADTAIWFTTPALVPTLHPLPLPTGMAVSRGKSMEPEFLSSSHLPPELQGVLLKSTYFTSQVQLYRLKDNGSGFASEDLGDLMSGEREFRPVETRVGPDGALYVCDWLNPVIGHYQASYRDPRRDLSHGRIWRVSAKDRPLVSKTSFAALDASGLIARLSSPERFERDSAKQALFRKPAAEVLAALAKVDVATASDALLYELSGVLAAHEKPDPAIVSKLLASKDFRYRCWGVRLLGVLAGKLPDPLALLTRAATDEHPRVRLEAVVACGWMPPNLAPEAMKIATLVLDKPMDAPLSHALTLCIHALAPHWRPALAEGRLDFGDRPHALARVLATVGDGGLTAQVRSLLDSGKLTSAARGSLLAVLVENGSTQDAAFALAQAPDSQPVIDAFVALATRKADPAYGPILAQLLDSPHSAARLAACRFVAASGRDHGSLPRLSALLAEGNNSSEERGAALAALAKVRGKAALAEILSFADSPDVTLRHAALAAAAPLDPAAVAARGAKLLASVREVSGVGPLFNPLLGQKGGAEILAKALAQTKPDAATARLALQWMSQVGRDDASLREVLNAAAGITSSADAYSGALVTRLVADASAQGDAKRGEAVFRAAQSACLTCHKIGSEGGLLGPDLSAIGRAMTREAITESVFWPKRQVKEGYLLTQVVTRDGRTLQGYQTKETPVELTLKDIATNTLQNIPKATIASRSDTGTLMPDGLTATLSPRQQLDLLRYLFDLGK